MTNLLKFALRNALAAALVMVPVAVLAFTAQNRLNVNPVNANVFEVIGRAGSSGADFWCAASDFAHRQLRAPWQSKIYIARSRGASVTSNRRSAVHFTLDPAAAGITPIDPSPSLNALRVGDNMSVQLARTFCQRALPHRF